jgi:hypothetical protein
MLLNKDYMYELPFLRPAVHRVGQGRTSEGQGRGCPPKAEAGCSHAMSAEQAAMIVIMRAAVDKLLDTGHTCENSSRTLHIAYISFGCDFHTFFLEGSPLFRTICRAAVYFPILQPPSHLSIFILPHSALYFRA